jgi:hypothetical protein
MFNLQDKVRIIGSQDVYTIIACDPSKDLYRLQLGNNLVPVHLKKGSELELAAADPRPEGGFSLIPISCERLW